VGFGAGIERIILGLKAAGVTPPESPDLAVFVAHFGGETKVKAVQTAFALRDAGLGALVALGWGQRSLKSQMREADRHDARLVIVIGEDELESGRATVREMVTGEQTSIPFTELETWLTNQLTP
jgi:histidyl-tRNA synthetase